MSKSKSKSGATPTGATLAQDFEAAISGQQLQDSERAESGPGNWAVSRRMTLAVLTRTSAELRAAWADPKGQEALLQAIEVASEWRDHMAGAVQLADMAIARLLLTGQTVAEAQS